MRAMNVQIEARRIRLALFRARDNLTEPTTRRLLRAVPLDQFGRQLIAEARELLYSLLDRGKVSPRKIQDVRARRVTGAA